MASFRTQFHALENELADFVQACMETHHVYATMLTAFPFGSVRLTQENLRYELTLPRFAEIMFTLVVPDLSETSQLAFLDKNPGAMFLNIGRLGSRGLEQSSLSTMDANPIWRKINSDLKRKATTGADFLHEENGAKGVERNFRFTPGARALSKAGMPLRAFAQSPVVYYPK